MINQPLITSDVIIFYFCSRANCFLLRTATKLHRDIKPLCWLSLLSERLGYRLPWRVNLRIDRAPTTKGIQTITCSNTRP